MAASSLALLSSFRGPELCKAKSLISHSKSPSNVSFSFQCRKSRIPSFLCSVSVSDPQVLTGRPGDLVASILSKVTETDRGVLLTKEQQEEVTQVAQELQKYCVAAPVKCPLIFGGKFDIFAERNLSGMWSIVRTQLPLEVATGVRWAVFFSEQREMIQAVEAPDTVRNKVSFSALGFLDGEVSLKGKLKALDDRWIQVIFEAPQLKVGSLEFQYGGESEVKLQITYIDEKIRLGKGSRGSLFVFQRRE
ncbi:hypothetical protein OIU84_009723 [Salix udensis]|uniref:Plastid lipid-associated protein/fibrillin conserved domain-containing protein n=1 Tax=Salix udensis TaxID=889485 RepID=A0AAD6JJS0_9ROSI|nr:hypothetical protein OIU84_009723 [Salix udensis]